MVVRVCWEVVKQNGIKFKHVVGISCCTENIGGDVCGGDGESGSSREDRCRMLCGLADQSSARIMRCLLVKSPEVMFNRATVAQHVKTKPGRRRTEELSTARSTIYPPSWSSARGAPRFSAELWASIGRAARLSAEAVAPKVTWESHRENDRDGPDPMLQTAVRLRSFVHISKLRRKMAEIVRGRGVKALTRRDCWLVEPGLGSAGDGHSSVFGGLRLHHSCRTRAFRQMLLTLAPASPHMDACSLSVWRCWE